MDKKLSALLAIFFAMFTVFALAIFLGSTGQLTTFTRAKEDFAASGKTSLLFAFPLLLKSDGISKSSISVFVRSEKGMPVKDKKVMISASMGELSANEITTDDKGKAMVTLTSNTPGSSVVEATIEGSIKIAQTLSITFE